ncbi:hypothetical protein LTR09_011586 [Extremus antarcticus]|uniref:Uncharacterized protein n=1 Tax=Extremus antarcticus TaxID=702011 RepID=A0AAJ0D6C3_9PEZI|nr:hypothetical protein LTR09_011586 [Extremus antarcticus]
MRSEHLNAFPSGHPGSQMTNTWKAEEAVIDKSYECFSKRMVTCPIPTTLWRKRSSFALGSGAPPQKALCGNNSPETSDLEAIIMKRHIDTIMTEQSDDVKEHIASMEHDSDVQQDSRKDQSEAEGWKWGGQDLR